MYQQRTIRLIGESQRSTAIAAVMHAPIFSDIPLEIIIRVEKKARGLDANAAYWAGPLRDIAEQAWVDNRQYKAEIWHEHFKEIFLPEDDDSDLESLVKDGYKKWDFTPSGKRVLIGSTTQLLRKGFAIYREQVEAMGAHLGVMFTAPPQKKG